MSLLVDLYVRLRDEMDRPARGLDPNAGFRTALVLTILDAAVNAGPSVKNIETIVRRKLQLPGSLP